MSALIPSLTHVRELELLHHRSSYWKGRGENDSGSPVYDALSLHWTSFVNLTRLSLAYILHFPFQSLASPNLSFLSLDWVTASEDVSDVLEGYRPAPCIETLRLRWYESTDFKDYSLVPFLRRSTCSLENLEFMGLAQDRDDDCSTFQMIELITPLTTLKTLFIGDLDEYIAEGALQIFKLTPFYSLCRFGTSVSVPEDSGETKDYTVFRWLAQQLDSLPFDHPLTSIEIDIPHDEANTPYPPNPRAGFLDREDWPAFDLALSTCRKRRLTLKGTFSDHLWGKGQFETWKVNTEKLLPMSAESGLVILTYCLTIIEA
ncbi:hypothetical protein DL96DRAFT_1628426 [Flagelloscypha sp. PMI_526]|nr:hypothetical protein DL96DRAFT_1628426 [Flagelloscypha sp. PMI_526]